MVDLNSNDLTNTLLSILSEFSLQTLEEICELLPKYDKQLIHDKLEYLSYQLLAVRKIEFDGKQYYVAAQEDVVLQRYRKEEYMAKRFKLYPILKFLRWMCQNSKYHISYMLCGEVPTCDSSLIIVNCNRTIYDIYFIPSNNIDFMTTYINLIDREHLRNYVNVNGTSDNFKDDIQRIIITEDENSLKQINVSNTKYKIYFDGEDIIFEDGDIIE